MKTFRTDDAREARPRGTANDVPGAHTPALPHSHACGASGFSLIELLAALAILVMIVGIMGMIFTESDRAWNLGTGRVINNTEGRAMLNTIAHDLQYAVADKTLSFRLRTDKNAVRAYGLPCDEISFVSLQHDSSESPRTAREIVYYVVKTNTVDATGRVYADRYQLLRQDVGAALTDNPDQHCYRRTNDWWNTRYSGTSRSVLSDNVAGFTVYAWNGSRLVRNFDSTVTTNLPLYVDVYLELLNERDALRAAQMAREDGDDRGARVISFVEKSVRRYTTRVYFHNRAGYEER